MRKVTVGIFGFIFGIICQFVGLIIGLQVSVTLGNILMFPTILLVSVFYGLPLGEAPGWLRLATLAFSGLVGAGIFLGVQQMVRRRRKGE